MPLIDDPWILDNSPISPEKLHALGVIGYRWNACELGVRILLASIKGPPFTQVWKDTSNARPSEILDSLEAAISASLHRAHVKEATRYAASLYEVNRKNRNQFSHFLASASKSSVALYNNKSRDFSEIFERPEIPSEIDDFRRVADEITACMRYLTAMSNYLIELFYNPLKVISEPAPLPARPPLPDLHWKSPPRTK